jgi:hypothetical protein
MERGRLARFVAFPRSEAAEILTHDAGETPALHLKCASLLPRFGLKAFGGRNKVDRFAGKAEDEKAGAVGVILCIGVNHPAGHCAQQLSAVHLFRRILPDKLHPSYMAVYIALMVEFAFYFNGDTGRGIDEENIDVCFYLALFIVNGNVLIGAGRVVLGEFLPEAGGGGKCFDKCPHATVQASGILGYPVDGLHHFFEFPVGLRPLPVGFRPGFLGFRPGFLGFPFGFRYEPGVFRPDVLVFSFGFCSGFRDFSVVLGHLSHCDNLLGFEYSGFRGKEGRVA